MRRAYWLAMTFGLLTFGLGSLTLCGAAATAADWPTWQGSISRNARSAESLPLRQLGVLWHWESPGPPRTAWFGPAKWDAYAGIRGLRSMRNYDPVFHPVSVGDAVYFGSSSDDSVTCLDATRGTLRWRYTTDGPVRIAPTVWQDRVYFGSDDGHAYCLNASDGSLLWKYAPPTEGLEIVNNGRLIPFWPCRTGVLVDQGTAYFACSLLPWKPSFLCAVDAKSGQAEGPGRWIKSFSGQTFEGPLAATAQQLIVPRGRVAPQLFSRQDGRSMGTLKGGGGSFVVLTDDARILHGPGNKTGWITESGQKGETIATFKDANAMVVDGNRAYMLTDTSLAASDFVKRKPLWRADCEYPLAMVLAGKQLILGGEDAVAAFDVSSGRRVWEQAVRGRVHGLAVANQRLLVSTDVGSIYCFAAGGSGKEVAAGLPDKKPKFAGRDLQPLEAVSDDGLLDRWVFQPPQLAGRQVQNLARRLPARILGAPSLIAAGQRGALACDGRARIVVQELDDFQVEQQPVKQLSAEAWVRVDKPQNWGGLIGAVQDNGSYERGWLLGYRGSRFSLAVAAKEGKAGLSYVTAPVAFEPQRWYYVAGTYDGAELRLYVDGKLVSRSAEQSGDIDYPEQAYYELASYHDKDEQYPLQGALHQVRVYRRVLSADEIRKHHHDLQIHQRAGSEALAAGPYLKFDSPDSAVVYWETHSPVATRLNWGHEQEIDGEVQDAAPKRLHTARIGPLQKDRQYRYTLVVPAAESSGETSQSIGPFDADMFFNYELPAALSAESAGETESSSRLTEQTAVFLLEQLSTRRAHPTELNSDLDAPGEASRRAQGICLLAGGSQHVLAWELVRRSRLRCVIVDTDADQVARSRDWLHQRGVFGDRVAVRRVSSLTQLPFTRWFANLVVATDGVAEGQIPALARELQRVTRPDGGVTLVRTDPASESAAEAWQAALVSRNVASKKVRGPEPSRWVVRRQPPVKGSGSWTHLYGAADNSAFGGETLQDATRTEDLEVQWIGRPGPRYQADRSGRKPSPLSAGGHLFLQGDQRLLGLDAYNGTVLWALEIPALGRYNMPRDCSNWCADPTHVYAAIADRCWQVDAQTGTVARQFTLPQDALPPAPQPAGSSPADGTAATPDPWHWGYVARHGPLLLGTAVRSSASFKTYWGSASEGWYDSKSGDVTNKVCGDLLFALDKQTSKLVWQYEGGLLIHSTITIGEQRTYFLECRSPELKQAAARRLGGPAFWDEQYFVALDTATGKRLWERKVDAPAGKVVSYLAYGHGKLALVGSGDNQYHVSVYDAEVGKPLWQNAFRWPSDNHGGHMARPAIVGNSLYVRPKAFELATGTAYSLRLPGGGCGTYAATSKALFFRSGNVTVWDRLRGNTSKWGRLRPDCWLSTIPAGGMLLSPEGGGGCSCGSWLETSLGFVPRVPDPVPDRP